MSRNNDLFALPASPSELCFDKNEFMKSTFSVDDFLHEHRSAASLEVMRDDLGIYLKILRSAMIELINEDYADFVNLSANLIDFDQSIENIKKPLQNLKEEIISIQNTLQDNMNDIRSALEKKKLYRMYKKNLKSLARVYESMETLKSLLLVGNGNNDDESLNPLIIERAALEFIQLEFNIQFCGEYLSNEQRENAKQLHSKLLEKLQKYFLNSLLLDSSNSTSASAMENLERCLRIYATLDEYRSAEEVFRTNVVAKYMNNLISENALQSSSHKGLSGIYEEILNFIPTHMKNILLYTLYTDKIRGYNFLVYSFWREVEFRLENHMTSIFAPGNPDSFYQRYKCTQDFLLKIELTLGKPELIQQFREEKQYQSFQTRWNLPVYFQIRFQEIAGQFETSCSSDMTTSTSGTTVATLSSSSTLLENLTKNFILSGKESNGFKLMPIISGHEAIVKSWSDGIYIDKLFLKFWKLTLQILSRINQWTLKNLKQIVNIEDDSKMNKIQFLIVLYCDLQNLLLKIPEILKLARTKAPNMKENILQMSLEDSRRNLNERIKSVENILIKEIVHKSCVNIKQVNDIPRLYRKTNREVPKKNCSYVEQMLAPMNWFQTNSQDSLGTEKTKELLTKCFGTINNQYYNAVTDVLTSVQKTEESLRRLKNLREKSSTNAQNSSIGDRNPATAISDDDKIRLQLQVDCIYWTNKIESCNIKRSDVEKLEDLINLVEGATKIKIQDKN